MKKLINKRIIICILAFFIPIFIVWGNIIFNELITKGHAFYNGKSFLIADMGSQYNNLYHYFHNIMVGKDSIFYSFYNAIGNNMASTIGYYLSSPFNILYGFVNKNDIPLMTIIIYSIKIALCSLFMNIYLGHKFGHKYTNLIFSLTYAFMGFLIVYYFNNMWIDVIYMTPLVMMGIDKLIGGKPLTYIITLSLSIIFNFYFAYMLCIFCLIYFIYELFIKYEIKNSEKYNHVVKSFLISSLLAAGLSAFFLLPVILNLSESLRFPIDESSLNMSNFFNKFVEDILPKTYFISHNSNSLLGRKRAVIYINLFSLLLSIFYFLNNKISRKEKILSGCVILIFILSFMMPYLQLFWQGFSMPNGYIDRYSYLYCVFLILLAAKQFYSNSLPKLKCIISFLVIYIALGVLIFLKKLTYVNGLGIIISIILIFIYAIVYIFICRIKKTILKKVFIGLTFIIIFLEIVINYHYTFSFINGLHDENPFPVEVCYNNKNDNSDFYRIDNFTSSIYLESFMCDFYTTSSALSTNNGKLHKFMYNNGASLGYMYSFYDNSYVPVFSAITGTKYLYGAKKLDNDFYKLYDTFKIDVDSQKKHKFYVYENPYALNLGFAIDDNYISNYEKGKNTLNNSFDNLNNLFKSISGIKEDVFVKLDKKKIKSLDYVFNVDKKTKWIYFTATYSQVVNFAYYSPLYVNDEYLITLNTFNIGNYAFKNNYYNEEIIVGLDDDELIKDINLYYFEKEVFEKGINKLKEHQLTNIKLSKNKINADISLDKDSTIFLSIPYDKGWKVYVDGKKVKTVEIADMFMGIKVPKGNHKIYMKFYPRGLKLGIIITILSFYLLIHMKKKGICIYESKIKKDKRKNIK